MSSPMDWYSSLPPVTRAFGTGVVVATVGAKFGLVSPYALLLSWPAVTGKLQLWRLASTFLYAGDVNMNFVIQMLWIFRYGVQLETVAFLNRTPDFAYALLFCAAVLVASTLALPTAFLTASLIAVLLYLWSRENPAARVSFFGLFTVDGFYLPWVMVGWTLVSGGSPVEELRGIVAAHLYWFLSHEWPRAGGPQNLMATPEFVRQMVAWAFGGHHMTQASFQRQQAGARGAAPPPPQPQRAGGGAFQGRGRRLNE